MSLLLLLGTHPIIIITIIFNLSWSVLLSPSPSPRLSFEPKEWLLLDVSHFERGQVLKAILDGVRLDSSILVSCRCFLNAFA